MFRDGLCSRVDHLLRSPHRSQFGHIGDVNDPFAVEQARRRGPWYGFERDRRVSSALSGHVAWKLQVSIANAIILVIERASRSSIA